MNDTTPTSASGSTAAAAGSARGSVNRRRVVVGIVWLLTIAAVAAAGYVGWQRLGTDVVASREQADLRDQIRLQWRHPTVADILGPQNSVSALGTAEGLVRIPRFGTDYEVPLIEGVRDEDLSLGIGHFPGTEPGQIGNLALTAHRVTSGDIFAELKTLRPGDKVVIETSSVTYTYVMDTDPRDLVLPITADWVLHPVPVAPGGSAPPGMPPLSPRHPTEALITLTTSSEIFHSDTRLVAFGHLISIEPK